MNAFKHRQTGFRPLGQQSERIDGLLDDSFGAGLIEQAASLSGYARRLTGGAGADADDLLQDTMLRCWAARRSFVPDTNLGAWMRTVMRNSFLSGRRRARFHADLSEDAFDRVLGVAEGQGAAVDLRDVKWAIGELIPEQRVAILFAAQGLSIEEASARLGIPAGTFKSRLWRGRLRLKRLIEHTDTPLLDRGVVEKHSKPRPRRNWKGVVIG
ncbi:MAG: sigma-70 family RNA polymerase sigma factor [Sphingobium sp.]|uniref:RNA polymerase sigma factor n=1 Tax=Sphingobium sp. TaxID=1912891 RepID=UPI0029BEE4EE|nr:sigma-70 family RNA polymerase sigma factor [Sphingobium sp.]MDX3911677.1 sigma-70 family RNA polymerase sigma factor [Sphingobium sp.]